MSYLLDNCVFCELTREVVDAYGGFSCADEDISEFFNVEFADYTEQLLGKSYCFVTQRGERAIVCAFTVANSCIKVDNLPNKKRNKINRKIPNAKRRSQYPAVLVGQLAVNSKFRGLHIGGEVMDFIKSWFIDPLNKTGCRYIIVDAINTPKVLQYYTDNGFSFIFSSDEEESKYMLHQSTVLSWWERLRYRLFPPANLNLVLKDTRLMFFDLMVLSSGTGKALHDHRRGLA